MLQESKAGQALSSWDQSVGMGLATVMGEIFKEHSSFGVKQTMRGNLVSISQQFFASISKIFISGED